MSGDRGRGGALVTGAGAGLGRETALRLGAMGYTVHVTDVEPATRRLCGRWSTAPCSRRVRWSCGSTTRAVYAGSKHAVMGLSLSTMLDLRIAGLKDVTISCICTDGMWTAMLYDKLDDPGAAMSFSGVLLQPGDVADVVARVVGSPRPVRSRPGGVPWRAPSTSRRGSRSWVDR